MNTQQPSVTLVDELIKKLRGKAELTRYCHSRLKTENERWQRGIGFGIVILSLVLSALTGFYYREILSGELIMAIIFILPMIIAAIQVLSDTVFRWGDNVVRHESAVQKWGHWIREAKYTESILTDCVTNPLTEEENIYCELNKKYIDCMNTTPQIPDNKFLKYKAAFKIKRLLSCQIDDMDLEELQQKYQDQKNL